jgi:ABC-type antimicrobial peptide transport system permease subunit
MLNNVTMDIQATTDREIMIALSGKIDNQNSKMDNLADAMEKFAESLEKLEVTKVGDIEKRVDKLEKWANEWSGVYKFIGLVSLLLGGISIIVTIYNTHG